MIRTTYRGRAIKVLAARGKPYHRKMVINGRTVNHAWQGDDTQGLNWFKQVIDKLDAAGPGNSTSQPPYERHWWEPGTFDVNPNGHVTRPGGVCVCTRCVIEQGPDVREHRYPSDMSDAEWALIAPLLPPPAATLPTGGHPEVYERRDVVDAVRYVNRTGCQWRAVPADFPPWATVYRWFRKWHAAGVTTRICAELYEQVRLREGKNPRSVTVVVDSQTVKADATVPRTTSGYDAGKKATGRKRHLAVDTRGLPVMMMVTPANLHDAHAARDFLFRLRLTHPEVTLVWADSAYGGELVPWAKDRLRLTLKTVNRPKTKGFVLLPKRWVVERSISWIMRARRNCRDYEALPQHAEAHLAWTVMALMTRRLTKPVADWREPKPPPPPPAPPLRVRLHPWTVRLAPSPR